MSEISQPTGKRIKTQYVGVYFRYGKNRMCPDGKPDKCFDITYKDTNGNSSSRKSAGAPKATRFRTPWTCGGSVCAKSAIPNCSEKRRPLLYPPA